MSECRDMGKTNVSNASTTEEVAQFWDTHSLDDHWDETLEIEFEIRAQQRRRVTLDPELYAKIEAHARHRGLLPETLVNIWLTERVQGTL